VYFYTGRDKGPRKGGGKKKKKNIQSKSLGNALGRTKNNALHKGEKEELIVLTKGREVTQEKKKGDTGEKVRSPGFTWPTNGLVRSAEKGEASPQKRP